MSESAAEADEPRRLLTLADGVFAIAVTLLVLNITVRQGLDPAQFRRALRDTVPELLSYALSFAVITALWRDHRRIFDGVRTADEVLTRLTLLGLGLIALLPFPTTLLAEYGSQPEAVAIYSGSVAVVDGVQLALLLYLVLHPRLLRTPLPRSEVRLLAADLGTTIAVFALAVPVAFASAYAAKWCWLLLVPAKFAVRWARHRAKRR